MRLVQFLSESNCRVLHAWLMRCGLEDGGAAPWSDIGQQRVRRTQPRPCPRLPPMGRKHSCFSGNPGACAARCSARERALRRQATHCGASSEAEAMAAVRRVRLTYGGVPLEATAMF